MDIQEDEDVTILAETENIAERVRKKSKRKATPKSFKVNCYCSGKFINPDDQQRYDVIGLDILPSYVRRVSTYLLVYLGHCI